MAQVHRHVILLTLLGLALRLAGLGTHSFWYDEAREILRSMTPWPDILLVSEGADPPALRLLLSPITAITLNELWLRLPAVLFGVAAIYLAYRWLAALGYPRLGLTAAALLAFAPVEVYYSQEVSQYSLSVFLGLLVLIAFEQAARDGRWRDWTLLAVVSLAAFYTYYGLAWLFPALDLDLAWRTWHQRTRRRLVGFAGFHGIIAVGLFLLYRLMLAVQFERFAGDRNLPPRFVETGLAASLRTLDKELFVGFLRFFFTPWSRTVPKVIPVFFGGLLVLGSIALWRRGSAGRRIVYILLAVLLTMYIANGFGIYPFGSRYALFVTPLFFTLIAAFLQWLERWRHAAIIIASIIAVVFIAFSPNIHLLPNPWLQMPREELRPVLQHLHQQIEDGDFIYVYYGAKPAYQVYQPGDDEYPTELGPWFRFWPLEEKLEAVHQAVGERQRFWLVMSHIYRREDQELIDGLEQTTPAYHVIDEFRAQNAAAVLFQRY